MSGRRTRSGGAAQSPGPRSPHTKSPKSLRRSQRKSVSDIPNNFTETWPKTPVRKPIVLKKIVAHATEIPSGPSLRRSSTISFILEKENNPPLKQPTKEDLFKAQSIPCTPTTTPVQSSVVAAESDSGEKELDARDLEMSKKVRRSYSRLEARGSASTSTPGHQSFFGFEGLEDLPGVSPVICSKLVEIPDVPAKSWAPDTAIPGVSPPAVKEKRKRKKVPEILKSQLDEWAAAMNAEFEAAEQFDLLIE